MLRCYQDAVAMCADAARVARAVEKFDSDLARQLRRAATSVLLNLGEGDGTTGGHRRQRYLTAMGSAREVVACFDAAEAMQYASVDAGVRRRLDIIIGTLVRVVHGDGHSHSHSHSQKNPPQGCSPGRVSSRYRGD